MENNHYIEQRPWGSFEILSEFKVQEPGFFDSCVKKLVIKPGKRLSYQSHKQRNEHWFFVQGEGMVILDDKKIEVKVGSSVDIKTGNKHRAENTGKTDLIIIETETGRYDENDIERLEDDFGRVKKN